MQDSLREGHGIREGHGCGKGTALAVLLELIGDAGFSP